MKRPRKLSPCAEMFDDIMGGSFAVRQSKNDFSAILASDDPRYIVPRSLPQP
jgi:hypothetical protein